MNFLKTTIDWLKESISNHGIKTTLIFLLFLALGFTLKGRKSSVNKIEAAILIILIVVLIFLPF